MYGAFGTDTLSDSCKKPGRLKGFPVLGILATLQHGLDKYINRLVGPRWKQLSIADTSPETVLCTQS
jgi:hypothetical protein